MTQRSDVATTRHPSAALSLAVALGATAIAGISRALLAGLLGHSVPYITFFASVTAAAWFGGWLGGVVATTAAIIVTQYYFIEPLHQIGVGTLGDAVAAALFVAECLMISAIIATLHRLRHRVAAQNQTLLAEIGERVASQRAVQAQAQQLHLTLMSIDDAVIVTDAAGQVKSMNPTAQRLIGWNEADASTRAVEELMRLQDDRSGETLPSPSRKALVDDAVVRVTDATMLVRRSAPPVSVEATAAPIHDVDGSVSGSVLVLQDVSERRVADAALRESERELADFFHNANVGLHWVASDGIIVRANEEELRMLGYRESEYVGRPMVEFHEDRRVAESILRTMETGERLQGCAARLRCADGSLKDVLINSSVRSSADGVRHVRAVTLDVSDRVAADRTRALLAAVVESSADAIVTKGLDGVVTSWNSGAERLFGYTAQEAVGKHITFIIPSDQHEDEREILRRIESGKKVPPFETTRLRKGGESVFVSLAVSPVRDSTGRVIGASKVARDLSERISMERALREANRRKDEFLATLAHELRNPLAPMRHGLHLLAAPGADTGRLQQVTGILSRQLDHMVRLIDDLLDLSRINRDKLELQLEPVRLDAIVRQAVETVRPLIDQASHELLVHLPDESIALEGDAVRLSQVMTNLLSNAAKFTNPGGRIVVTATREHEMVHVRVRDTGIGIPPDKLEGVFEMFSQGHDGLEQSRGGLGIGLTLVRRIVELHGGRVQLESDGAGMGTTATVMLPLGTMRGKPGVPATDALPTPLVDRRILVADDNRDSADTLAMLLTLRGGVAMTAYDGEQAVATFAADHPDIVLLDLGMPLRSGLDACRAIRLLPGGREAVIVALTGWGQEQDRRRSQEAGFDGHLVKPVDAEVLIALLLEEYAKRVAR